MQEVRFGIARKLGAMAGAILLVTGKSMLYLALSINSSTAVIEDQIESLEALATTESVSSQFADVRYWMTDLALSWLNESESNAAASSEQLEGSLVALERTNPREVEGAASTDPPSSTK